MSNDDVNVLGVITPRSVAEKLRAACGSPDFEDVIAPILAEYIAPKIALSMVKEVDRDRDLIAKGVCQAYLRMKTLKDELDKVLKVAPKENT